MKLCLIGNCSYQALIDDRAAVRWLCWPRFDSSFVFGSLLDKDQGGEFSIALVGEHVRAEQTYIKHTNIVRTEFHGSGGGVEVVDFAPRFLLHDQQFKPTMLVRRVRVLTGAPRVRVVCRPVYDYGLVRPDAYLASNHIQWLLSGAQLRLTTNAPLSYVREGHPFVADDDLYFVLTWGHPLEAPLVETCEAYLRRTRSYWQTWVKHAALPDEFQEEVIRSALCLKIHQYEDTGAITAAATTSLPEAAGSGRNWDYRFCWLRDSCFTLGALRRLGHFEEMEGFAAFFRNIAATDPRRLQPVYGIGGERLLEERVLDHLSGYGGHGPVRVGNAAFQQEQNDVFGEMIATIAPTFVDSRFREHGQGWSTNLIHELVGKIAETLEQPDAGLWEKRQQPRLHTFSWLMHWVGATAAGRVGERHGDSDLITSARSLAARARRLIEDHCWRPDLGYYADSPDTNHADAALLLMINFGLLEPTDPRAETHLRGLVSALAADSHLLYRYRHDDGIGDTRNAFTVCGFWQAEALARLGHRDEARKLFEQLLSHANHVGLLSEDIDPSTGVQWGNFPQTYSHVGVINAAFAISPRLPPIL